MDAGVTGIFDVQEIGSDTVDVHAGQAAVAADAVLLVHYGIAGLQLLEAVEHVGAYAAASVLAAWQLLAQQLASGQHQQPFVCQGEAGIEETDQALHRHLSIDVRPARRFVDGCGQRLAGLEHALPLARAVGHEQ